MKRLLTILLLLTCAFRAQAQIFGDSNDKFFVGYEVALPSGFLTEASWVGVRFEYRRMITPKLSVGVATSWNSFSQYISKSTYQKKDGDGALTTDMVREIYSVPITLSSHYYLATDKKVVPYIGLGLGTQYSDQTVYMNVYGLDEYNWGFVARPEVGIIIPVYSGGVYLSAAYNYATNHNDAFNINDLKHFAFTIGFNFGIR